jgi:hypothetical protein
MDGREIARAEFNLGGPAGTWNTPTSDQVGPLSGLLGDSPLDTIEAMELSMGLNAPTGKLAASTPRILGLRLTAEILESRVFDSTSWRASLGAFSWNGGIEMPSWVTPILPAFAELPPRIDEQLERRLSELICVHQTDVEGLDGGSFDVRNGLAIDLHGEVHVLSLGCVVETVDILAEYEACGRRIRQLANRLQARVESHSR